MDILLREEGMAELAYGLVERYENCLIASVQIVNEVYNRHDATKRTSATMNSSQSELDALWADHLSIDTIRSPPQ